MRRVEDHHQASARQDVMAMTAIRIPPAMLAEIDQIVLHRFGSDVPLRSKVIRELLDLGLQAARAKAATGK
jgi:metal-responsive CopG/Arc/MetJ family transcriptional regulator